MLWPTPPMSNPGYIPGWLTHPQFNPGPFLMSFYLDCINIWFHRSNIDSKHFWTKNIRVKVGEITQFTCQFFLPFCSFVSLIKYQSDDVTKHFFNDFQNLVIIFRNWCICIGNYTVWEELMKNTARIWWKWLNAKSAQHEWYSASFINYKQYFSLILQKLRWTLLLIKHLHKIQVSGDKKMQKTITKTLKPHCMPGQLSAIN